MVPAKMYFPEYCELASCLSPSRIWSTSLAMAARESWPMAPLFADTTIWRTRSTMSLAWVRAVSAVLSHDSPSSMLREYCWVRCLSARSCMALTVSTGESDGRLSRRPEESCSWVRCRRVRLVCRPSSTPRASVPWVTRNDMSVLPSAGHVDEGVQRRVDRGDELRRRLVGVLVGHEVGHLLVEADARGGRTRVLELARDRGLQVCLPVGGLCLHSEADHEGVLSDIAAT